VSQIKRRSSRPLALTNPTGPWLRATLPYRQVHCGGRRRRWGWGGGVWGGGAEQGRRGAGGAGAGAGMEVRKGARRRGARRATRACGLSGPPCVCVCVCVQAAGAVVGLPPLAGRRTHRARAPGQAQQRPSRVVVTWWLCLIGWGRGCQVAVVALDHTERLVAAHAILTLLRASTLRYSLRSCHPP
jgi:hypothetical protein